MPGQPEEDHQLLKHAQQGEADAFGVLYERHAAAIFRYLYAHLGSRFDAEDLTSDVFLRAWRSLPSYHHRGVPFRAFLFRIAHNALVDHYRRIENQPGPLHETDHPAIDANDNPAEILVGKSDQWELSGILNGMKDDYRTVLVLRFISQLSPQETAAVMKRSSGAVRVLQHRALEELRHRIVEKKTD
jgi:RNA polymerase sigma-70 factor (ECF subfamily)